MPENTSLAPEWVDDKTINEVQFCREFLQTHPMVSVGGVFFTKDGLVPDESLLKKQIYDSIKDHVTTGLGKKVGNLLEVLRMECCVRIESMRRTARCFWMAAFQRRRTSAGTDCRWPTARMRRSLPSGSSFSLSFYTRRISPLCRSSSVTV